MPTNLIPLACNNCGAPLKVPDDVKFVTCVHCHTSLSIEHEGDAYFTRQLEELTERTEEIDTKLNSVERQVQRQNLDLRWEIDRKKLMVKRKDGDVVIPKRMDSASSLFGMLFGFVALAVFGIFAAQAPNGIGGFFILFALVGAIVLVASNASEHSKAVKYETALRRYQNEKARLSKDSE